MAFPHTGQVNSSGIVVPRCGQTIPLCGDVKRANQSENFRLTSSTSVEYRTGMRELTDRQREVLGFIRSFTARHGVPPTVREIGERFRVTPRAAFDHLRALERKGMLQRRHAAGRTSRALTLAEPGAVAGFRSVPVLGRVAAGAPLLAEENREGELPLASTALPNGGEDVFALRIRGGSMIDAHICDGDLVRVRRQDTAEPNDIVVAAVAADSGE